MYLYLYAPPTTTTAAGPVLEQLRLRLRGDEQAPELTARGLRTLLRPALGSAAQQGQFVEGIVVGYDEVRAERKSAFGGLGVRI